MKKVLVIDDDTYICDLLVSYLQRKGYESVGAYKGTNALRLMQKDTFDVVLCDYRLPNTDGEKMLQSIKSIKPELPVIIMTAYSDVKTAVKLIKSGAYDYVTKPIQPEEILQLISKASRSEKPLNTDASIHEEFVTGTSKWIREVMEHIRLVAPTNVTVMIEGETGSGKEYIARALHHASSRREQPFVAVDCGAIPKDLANSELFGHIKGAFTGAVGNRTGFFEQANGGTLFLDEVGNLPPENQVKLLRALQEGTISRIGASESVKVDVRLISATNSDLLGSMGTYEFREDLYHRLNGFKIKLPALRQRKEDIMEFTNFFIIKANKAFDTQVKGISDPVRDLFHRYVWHGNLRELQNVVNRAVLLTQSGLISADALPEELRKDASGIHDLKESPAIQTDAQQGLKEATVITEKELISNALARANFNKSMAARMLNIDRKTLYNKIKLYRIPV